MFGGVRDSEHKMGREVNPSPAYTLTIFSSNSLVRGRALYTRSRWFDSILENILPGNSMVEYLSDTEERVSSSLTLVTFGVPCSKAGELALQAGCVGLVSLALHKIYLVV